MDDRIISRDIKREQIRQRLQSDDLYSMAIPAAKIMTLTDEISTIRVAAYCRVLADDPAQITSNELQKKHYEKLISSTPGCVFAGAYIDRVGASFKHQDELSRMIKDCKNGMIDMVITKSISSFSCYDRDCVAVTDVLFQLNPPVGVWFEKEGVFSLER